MKQHDDKTTEQMKIIVENLPFPAWFKDSTGRYTIINQAFIEETGLVREGIIGRNDYDILPKGEADIYTASDQAVISGDAQGYYEAEYKKGQFKEEYKKAIFDAEGQLLGTTGISRDITKRVLLQNALKESERSKSMLISNLPGVAFRSNRDQNWDMAFLSEGCFDLTGYTAEQLLAGSPCSFNDLIRPDYKEQLFKKWEADKASKDKTQDEYPIITASGALKWVWEQSQVVCDDAGNVIATEGFITDITERKLAEDELTISEERFRTIFEEAPLGIAIYDSETGRVYQINNQFADILGRTVEEMFRTDWMSISHPDELEENLDNLALLSEGKITGFAMNKRYFRPDGSIVWAHMTIVPFKSPSYSSPRHLCMLEDISINKKREDEILYLSYHDILTGLYNRAFFEEEGRRLGNSRQLPLSVIMGDMNGLKFINDALGHSEGDKLLIKTAEILKSCCRNEDIVARVGGDEFCILLPKTSARGAQTMCRRIYRACKDYSSNPDQTVYHLSLSLGFATKTQATESLENLLREAEDLMYTKKNMKRKQVHVAILNSIIAATLEKSHETREHTERLAEMTRAIGKKMKLSGKALKELKLLAAMHDIGKVTISDDILMKSGTLNEEEWSEIRRHPEAGYRIAQASLELKPIGDYILTHHERWDGDGYPKKLSGTAIPLLSRIFAVVDAYDVMTQKKPYGQEKTKAQAIREIEANSGLQFDPEVVAVFLNNVLH